MKKIITLIIFIISMNIGKAQTFTWTGFETIVDMQTDTLPIVVSGLPNIIDTSFGVAHICMYITHTYKSDLVIKILSPAGTLVTLIQGIGGSADNFTGTCLGMDGTTFANGIPPYTGLYLPTGDISTFNNGQNPNGTWKFIVSDIANQDTGSIHSASIAFVNNPPRVGQTTNPGPTGTYNCATCVCENGSNSCDLLPDMTSSYKEIFTNHTESPGFLYISNTTPNIGFGPIDIYGIDSCFCGTTPVPCGTACPNGDFIKHAVKQRIFQKLPGVDSLGYYDRLAGTMTYHPTHGHIHVDNWAEYTLRTQTSNPDARTWPIVGNGVKQSFCLINLGTCANNVGECLDNNGNVVTTVPNQNLGFHTGCGLTQGIYPGNYDVYSISLNDPIPLNNICNGTYYVVSITDPNNNFLESDENNNWVAVPITLTQQTTAPVISASGPTTFCQGGSVTLTSNVASNYLWSNGQTTRSIVVSAAGNYTVSTTCGTSVGTSSPVSVSLINIGVNATASPSNINCNGDPLQLTATASSPGVQNVPVAFTSNQVVAIPDNNTTGVTSAITVSGISPLTLTASSVVSVKLNLTHTYDGDLAISLISPQGSTIFLSNRRGGNGANFVNTVFSMSASTLIGAGSAPFTGSYKPDGNFASLTGNANGVWLLKVQDLANVDVGNILNWTITINNAVPEILSYSWSSVPAGFSSTLANPVFNPSASAVYTATVTSSSTGCIGTKSVSVGVPDVLTINNFSPAIGSPGTVVTINGSGFSNVNLLSIAGVSVSNFTIVNSGQITAVVPNVSNRTGVICVTNSNNCNFCTSNTFEIGSPISVNMNMYIEGYYSYIDGLMDNPTSAPPGGALYQSFVPGATPDDVDTVFVSAMDPVTFTEVDRQWGILHVDGSLTIKFSGAVVSGNQYYLKINQRNTLETWSSLVTISAPATTHLLSDGNGINDPWFNMKQMSPGIWAIYSGDIADDFGSDDSQNGFIDSFDFLPMDVDIQLGNSGYYRSDLDGDGFVTAFDFLFLAPNITSGVSRLTPP